MSWTPFFLKRSGPRGADTHKHMFCVGAKGNPELVRTGESDAEVLINGASGPPPDCRAAVQRLVDALNEQWERYLRGEFHEQPKAENGIYKCTKCRRWTVSLAIKAQHEQENDGHVMAHDPDPWPDAKK